MNQEAAFVEISHLEVGILTEAILEAGLIAATLEVVILTEAEVVEGSGGALAHTMYHMVLENCTGRLSPHRHGYTH